ncbi:MAG: hypothetical protein KHZ62_06735 [Clostridiales bacterium]|nr:hypothetical protein [Clostridiales bacterium]
METKKKNVVVCVLFALFFIVSFLMCVFLPKEEYSDSERRKLSVMPQLTVNTVLSGRFMSGFEAYAQDNFPYRDQFRTLKALTATYLFQRQDNNGIYVSEGFAAAVEYPMKEASLDWAANRFLNIYQKYLNHDNQVFLSIIPDKNCFLAKESGHLSMDYEQLETMMAQKVDFAEYISISDLLERDDYYKTDTHWRQERITDVAERLAKAMGVNLSGDYKEFELDREFYGVYCGQSALPLDNETIHYLTNDAIKSCTVYDFQNNKAGTVYDMERAKGKDPYEMFLSGPISLLTIENPKAHNDRELVMFRDSFGSSIAPLLLSGYSKITLVDIRYIQPDYLGQFIDFEGCDVLFLYSSLVLNNSDTLK